MRLVVKLKLVTDTYILQSKRAAFKNSATTYVTCWLCGQESEIKEHFILEFKILSSIREPLLNDIDNLCITFYGKLFFQIEKQLHRVY